MKRSFASITVVALFAGFCTLGLAFSRGQSNQRAGLLPAVQAQEMERGTSADNPRAAAFPRSRECTQGTVIGRYGSTLQGTVLPPNLPAVTPGVAVGTFQVDAAGNVTGADIMSLGGQIIPRTYSGALNVKADCTFTSRFSLNSGPLTGLVINSSGVIVSGGDEIQFVETDPGTLFTAVAKRL